MWLAERRIAQVKDDINKHSDSTRIVSRILTESEGSQRLVIVSWCEENMNVAN